MSPRLQVRALCITAQERDVVRGLDFDIAAGEVLGLVGRSGSGKSMTARALLGLPPAGLEVSGSVRLEGRELVGLPERHLCSVRGRGIGLVFQEPATALDPMASIGGQVAEGLRVHGMASAREARRQAADWLARLGLDPAGAPPGRRPHQLSGGQRQRAALATALALRPAVLVADEPTTALDAITAAEVADLLASHARASGMSLLLITHDLALAARLADRLLVLDAGQAVALGPTAEVLARPDGIVRDLRQAADARVLRRPPPPEDSPIVLSAERLTRVYANEEPWRRIATGFHAGVHDVSLTLRRGERLAVVGETGAGKSTLLRLLLGLERPQTGAVRLGEAVVNPAPAAAQRALRRHIQPVFQDPAGSFDPLWSAARIVAEPLDLLQPRLTAPEVAARVSQVLETVGLRAEDAHRLARSFSGGQRQRLALARALSVRPDVLVLDEATSALDTVTRGEIVSLLASLSERNGLACLFVTHDLAVVRALADRIIVLQAGRVVESGPAAQVLSAPDHPYTRALIAATPDLQTALVERDEAVAQS